MKNLGYLDDRNAVALCFVDRENSMKAKSIILKKVPDHAFIFPNALTIIMNKGDQRLFKGLRYEIQEVATPGEISNEEMAALRAEYLFGKEKK